MKRSLVFIALSAFVLSAVLACAYGERLRRAETEAPDPSVRYTLVLHGGSHTDDLKTIAILDKEGDPYTFTFKAPEFRFGEHKNLSAEDALEQARKFVSFHRDFSTSRMTALTDTEGNILAYEVRPLYQPSVYRHTDILDVNYVLTDDVVTGYIYIKREVERVLDRRENGPRRRR
jgi:hypothetical protein